MSRRGEPAHNPTAEEIGQRLERIVAGMNAGSSQRDIARDLRVGTATVTRYVRRARDLGLIPRRSPYWRKA